MYKLANILKTAQHESKTLAETHHDIQETHEKYVKVVEKKGQIALKKVKSATQWNEAGVRLMDQVRADLSEELKFFEREFEQSVIKDAGDKENRED